MSCDIHAFNEARNPDTGNWVLMGELELGRYYTLFGVMAGVRGLPYTLEPRGVPDDASEGYRMHVKDWGRDGHSHSWLTVAECREALDEAIRRDQIPKEAQHEYAKRFRWWILDATPPDARREERLVFFFDN